MGLDVSRHADTAAVLAIADEWQDLHDSSGDTNPFCGPEWPSSWLERFADPRGAEPYVLSVREHDRLVAVVPLVRRHLARGRFRMLCPVGIAQPWVLPFELPTLTVSPDQGRKAVRAAVEYLCDHADDWDVTRLMLGDAAPWFEPEWLPSFTFTHLPRRVRAVPVIELAEGRDIYAGRRNLKESFRRARNRLTRDHGADGWSVRRLDKSDEVQAGLVTLAGLHRQRSQMAEGEPAHPDALADPRVLDYVQAVAGRMADRGRALLYELLIGDEVVASQLALRTTSATYFSLTGAAERAWPYSAITYLQSQAVAEAQEAGHRLVQLSTGPNQTKMRWTDQVRVHPEFWIVAPRRRAQAFYRMEEVAAVLSSFREAREAH